ncbi:MAG TPA: hypothetical protein PLK38_06015, partial [Methanoregulaceae archaeon]|nr:hypothetical protein [Methanoregulaceae archaeon]
MRMRTPVWRRGLRDVTGERCWSAVPGGREPPPGSSRSVVVTLMNGGYIIWVCLPPCDTRRPPPKGAPAVVHLLSFVDTIPVMDSPIN